MFLAPPLTEVSSLDFGPAARGAFFAVTRTGARYAVSGRLIAVSGHETRQIEAEALPKKVTMPSNNAQRVMRCYRQGGVNLVERHCMKGRGQLRLCGFPAKSWGWRWAKRRRGADCVTSRIPWRDSGAIQSKASQLQARSMLGSFRLTPTRY
jgi:hypothetical protein